MARFPSKWILPGGPSLGNSRAACNFESRPSEKQVGSQLRLGLSSFLVRSRRGSVVRGTLDLFLFLCVCWVFQGRIT